MKPEQLKTALNQFIGTEHYFRFNPMARNALLTDGTKFLADETGAYWLMDAIASHLPAVPAEVGFVVVTLAVEGSKAVLTLADDKPAEVVYAEQRIGFTDFPLTEITLYVIRTGSNWVILLPSEY